jgi:type I restriction enzyme R subunit
VNTAGPGILYLADRNILIEDPMAKTFAPFGDARWKIKNGQAVQSREIYFAIYQAIARDERRPGLYREFAPDFFDLIIVDECHRGSAREDSNWREVLEYFEPAFQLGMTATPRRRTTPTPTTTSAIRSTPTACGRVSTTASSLPTASIAS